MIDPDREYKYLDIKALNEMEYKPVSGTVEEVIEGSLLDIIQLALSEGVCPEVIDRILCKIIDDRAKRLRAQFTLHRNED